MQSEALFLNIHKRLYLKPILSFNLSNTKPDKLKAEIYLFQWDLPMDQGKKFIKETGARFGILVNNSEKIEIVADKIIQIPAIYL